MVSLHSNATSNSSKNPKEKLMHNFINAMEHLLPIDHDKKKDDHVIKSHGKKVEKSNSFLKTLNPILQTSNSHHSGNFKKTVDAAVADAKQPAVSSMTKADKRKSILSDTQPDQISKHEYEKKDSSSSKEPSIKSIGFLHVNKSPVYVDSEDEFAELQEEVEPDLQITDDYIVNKNLAVKDAPAKSPSAPDLRLSTPHRSISDIPKASLSKYEAGSKSSDNIAATNFSGSGHALKPYGSSSAASDTNKEASNNRGPLKRSGTILLAPLNMGKLKGRKRGESVSKQDMLDANQRAKNVGANFEMSLNRVKANSMSTASTKSTNSDNRPRDPSLSSPTEEKAPFVEEVFLCALLKDILIQGRLQLHPDSLHFKSNIFGIKTDVEIPIKDILQIEKKTTAIVFPNGMIIKTVDKTYRFASFLNRDTAFEKIMKLWSDSIMTEIHEGSAAKSSKPTLEKSTTTGRSRNVSFKAPELFHGDENALKLKNPFKKMIHGFVDASSDEDDFDNSSHKLHSDESEDSGSESDDDMVLDEESGDDIKADSNKRVFGPDKGAAYNPSLDAYSKDTNVADFTIKNTTLGEVFQIMSENMYVLLEKGGNKNITKVAKIYTEDDNGEKLKDNFYKRDYTYVKPLNSSLGPKETKCVVKEVLEKVDLTKYFVIQQITETPDVPSGKSFHVITNMIFFWTGTNTVQLKAYTKVVWTGKSWIKGPVESGNTSGQKASMKSLSDEIQNLVGSSGHGSSVTPGKSVKKSKTSKKNKKIDSAIEVLEQEKEPEPEAASGILSSIKDSLSSFTSMSQYLTWFIVFYLIIDRYRTSSLISKHLKLQEDSIKKEAQFSEGEVWDWVLRRSEQDHAEYEKVLETKSSNNTEFTKFKKQELYMLRQLKQRELDVLNDYLL